MKLITPANRAEWLALRKGYISSTESAALFGYSPYLTAFEVGILKREADKATDEQLVGNERAVWGTRLQDAIAQGIADDYGVSIEPMGLRYAVRDDVRMGSSFDYQIIGTENLHPDLAGSQLIEYFQRLGPGILEVKNVDSLEYKRKWVDDEAPDHIEVQLQHQLETIGLPWGAIACLIGGNRVGLIVRERDQKFGKVIVRKVERFWADFDNGKLPDPEMPEDAGALIALHQYAEPEKVYDAGDDGELHGMVGAYEVHRAMEKKAKENMKAYQALILQKVGSAEKVINVPGFQPLTLSMVAPFEVKAYKNKGYRNFRLTAKNEETT
jgi:predicted phage-related endonuclease